jgi:hypothetical protein
MRPKESNLRVGYNDVEVLSAILDAPDKSTRFGWSMQFGSATGSRHVSVDRPE